MIGGVTLNIQRYATQLGKRYIPKSYLTYLPTVNIDDIVEWFKMTGRLGEGAAGQCATFYILLTEAKPKAAEEKPPKTSDTTPKKTRKVIPPPEPESVAAASAQAAATTSVNAPTHFAKHAASPTVHINLQIHISPEASLEQIDAIFKGIAEHLYNK